MKTKALNVSRIWEEENRFLFKEGGRVKNWGQSDKRKHSNYLVEMVLFIRFDS